MTTAGMKCSPRVAESILDLIGSTPLLRLNKVVPPNAGEVWAKLEAYNPGFSVKDRAALGMVLDAEQKGRLKPGDTIFEATAGNTGVGLALIGVQRGYNVVLFVPEKFAQEKVILMEAYGAKVYRTPEAEGMKGAIARCKAAAAEVPSSWISGQFENPANPKFHYATTGREIFEQMEGRIDAVVIGAGTGGTFSGVTRYVKERLPKVLGICVETQGSILGGGIAGPHAVEGIGNSFIPETYDATLADEVIAVNDENAFTMVRELARKEGVLGGSSAGAAAWAAVEVAKRLGRGKRVVTVVPDSAERYLSKGIFNFGIESSTGTP